MTNKLNAYLILDGSGSMNTMWEKAISGLNSYVDGLKKEGVDGQITAVVFDSQEPYKVVRHKQNVTQYENILYNEVSPRGMTPLYDAVGKAITNAEADNFERTVIVIMTDGEENSSKEYNRASIKAAVERCQSKNWEILFLGANFDVTSYAAAFGLDQTKFVNISSANFAETMTRSASKSASYTTTGAAMAYTAEDKADLA